MIKKNKKIKWNKYNKVMIYLHSFWLKILFILKKVSFGNNLKVAYKASISVPSGGMEVGGDFFAGPGLYISTNEFVKIKICDAVMMGPQVMILGGDHIYNDTSMHMRYVKAHNKKSDGICIEKGVWIGARCTLLSGAHVGEGCVVGAGSVVRSSLPPYTICAGVPAKPIKRRFNNQELASFLGAHASDCNYQHLIELYDQLCIN